MKIFIDVLNKTTSVVLVSGHAWSCSIEIALLNMSGC